MFQTWKVPVTITANKRDIIGESHLLQFDGVFVSRSYCGLAFDNNYLITEKEAGAESKHIIKRCKNCENVFNELTERRRRRR